jgi:hypothetical protein
MRTSFFLQRHPSAPLDCSICTPRLLALPSSPRRELLETPTSRNARALLAPGVPQLSPNRALRVPASYTATLHWTGHQRGRFGWLDLIVLLGGCLALWSHRRTNYAAIDLGLLFSSDKLIRVGLFKRVCRSPSLGDPGNFFEPYACQIRAASFCLKWSCSMSSVCRFLLPSVDSFGELN